MPTNQTDGQRIASSPLFKGFLHKAESYLRQPLRIKQLLSDAYQKASQKKELGHLAHEAWESMQTLFRLVRAAASGEYNGIPTPTVLAAVAVLIYFLSPIDFVPDFIPVVGLLDDVALMAWFTSTLKNEMDKFEEWERTRPQVALAVAGSTADATNVGSPEASSSAKFTASQSAAQPTQTGQTTGAAQQPSSDARPTQPVTTATSPVERAEHSVSSGSFVESPESGKVHGREDLPGGSQPDPLSRSSETEHHPSLDIKPNPNVTGASISGSRDPRLSDGRGGDTGGNVR